MSTTPIALPAINTYLFLGSVASPTTYGSPIANVGDYTGPQQSKQVVDVTSHSAPTPDRQKITTLRDIGDLTLPLYFIPADSDMQALYNVFQTNGFAGIRSISCGKEINHANSPNSACLDSICAPSTN